MGSLLKLSRCCAGNRAAGGHTAYLQDKAAYTHAFTGHPDHSISRNLFSKATCSSVGSLLIAFMASHTELGLLVTRIGRNGKEANIDGLPAF